MNRPEHPAYSAMVAAADGYLERFTGDLYRWDREALARADHGRPFLWALRRNGTHLAFCDGPIDGAGHMASDFPVMVLDAFREPVRWYRWDGATFAQISAGDAQKFAQRCEQRAS